MAERAGPSGVVFRFEQYFRYAYASPATDLRQKLVVVPRAVHGAQRRHAWSVTLVGAGGTRVIGTDGFGNHVTRYAVPEVDDAIEFVARATVAGGSADGLVAVSETALSDPRWARATRLTAADDRISAAAAELSAGQSGEALAEACCAFAHGGFTYGFGATDVTTTAAEALAGGRGVCQDYAHVMIALARTAGLAARYVSGHLVGEGGSHAWVEVLLPSRPGEPTAIAYDPTHARRANGDYLTVAVGRDYADVAPTSGTFDGEAPGVLTARKRLEVLVPAGTSTDLRNLALT